MDSVKRKSIIVDFLKGNININYFINEVGYYLLLNKDPILSSILSDLRHNSDAELTKSEILYFDDEQQKKESELLGSRYVESKKRRLTYEAHKYTSLLADPEIRTIIENWGTKLEKPAEEYKNTSFTNLLKLLESQSEYNFEIQEILSEIQHEDGLSEELQEFSDTLDNNAKEKLEQIEKRKELVDFMDGTIHTFDSLLQLESIDDESFENIKTASIESYKIYRDKYAQLTEELANNKDVFVTYLDITSLKFKKELAPVIKEKLEQIEKMIEQLEGKYGQFKQAIEEKEQEMPQEEIVEVKDNDFLSSIQNKVVTDDGEYKNNLENINKEVNEKAINSEEIE